ncbi:MAG: UvrD-helicase domain-containing protein [Bacteroidia bacterium]|nr:UvrD-helicase domain-containing protein [Bacteroidia bacterium]
MISESPEKLIIYRSSAGSGKTFTLVKEYLRLVLPDPFLYRNVLAVTFTNKATEEMKTRILEKLNDLAKADEHSLQSIGEYTAIKDELALHKPDPDSWVPDRARAILRSILGDYSHFSVSTIESFFQKILRAFARELDIPLGYEVEMKQSFVLDRLVEKLALDIGENPDLKELLSNYLLQQLEEEKGWDVFRELKSLGTEVFKEVFVDRVKGPMDEEDNILGLAKSLATKAWGRRRKTEGYLKKLATDAFAIMERFSLEPVHFKWKNTSVPGYFTKVLKGDFEPGARTLKGYENYDEWLPKKNEAEYDRVHAALDAGLWQLLRDILDYYEKHNREYFTDVLITQTASTFGLLGYLEVLLRDYRKENRMLLISDTSRLLTQVIRESDPPFVYEKAGHYYRHFLLDEFQDTSDLQWENFRPLIEESLGYGHFNLLVGDVKQAIYRWRNGNPQLMLAIEKSDPRLVEGRNLASNWRTAPHIVNLNNELFISANKLIFNKLAEGDIEERNTLIHQFLGEAYIDVAQTPQKDKVPGYVKIRFGESDGVKKEPFLTNALEQTHAWVVECREAGFAYRDMAILTRNNQEGIELARYLMSHAVEVAGKSEWVSVSSSDSLLLESHPQVRWLLASLRLCQYPEDQLLRANWQDLERSLSRPELAFTDFVQQQKSLSRLDAHFEGFRQLPIYEVMERLAGLLPPSHDANNAYVLGLLDAVWEYGVSVDTSITGFLAWWKEERHARAVKGADTDDAIRIMTIHQSKGLEFPVLIIPFIDWDLGLSANKKPIAWVETAGTAYETDFPILPVAIDTKMEKSLFSETFQREQILTHLDNLNLLYVALTRPQYRLYLYAPDSGVEKGKDSTPKYKGLKTVGHILEYLCKEPGEKLPMLNGGEDEFWCGEATAAPERVKKEKEPPIMENLGAYIAPDTRAEPLVKLRTTAWLERSPEGKESIEMGLLVHEALSRISTREELPQVVEALLLNGMLKANDKHDFLLRLHRILDHEGAKAWFEPGWEVKSEIGILEPSGKEKRPDRVLMKPGKTVVIDFKTGRQRPDHARQVKEYMDLLLQLGQEGIEGWIYYTGLGQVIPVN